MAIGITGILEAAAAAFVAGSVNSVSGGGTLITFPVLLALGMPSIRANATSTVALWPGIIASIGGYRKELGGAGGWAAMLLGPSICGGVLGAFLLLRTPHKDFDKIAPFLVLMATLLFLCHGLVSRMLKKNVSDLPEGEAVEPRLTPRLIAAYVVFQFVVAIYGGYFGAGMGILMLAALGMMGLTNIHRMNGLKAWAAFCINGVAVTIFAANHIVDWPVGLSMAAGSIAGGYFGARMARRVGQTAVRRTIITIGFIATISLLIRQW
ncbi:MAG TPA: sulfite exporter TauE/SafE family protein [Armatimonadota bacterium]|nr:sulfite exporter TauE/SafE family protein [Armatimonadota bacterium]